jgi:hypothetical protein
MLWCCPKCGTIANGPACSACGRPRGARMEAPDSSQPAGPYADIHWKIQRSRFTEDLSERWTWRGARIGALTALLLGILWGVVLSLPSRGKVGLTWGKVIGGTVTMFLGGGLLLSVLFAVVGKFLATVVRPIVVAIFCSPERFEREYGSGRDSAGTEARNRT